MIASKSVTSGSLCPHCILVAYGGICIIPCLRPLLVSALCLPQAELDSGAGVEALRRFNKALRAIPADKWGELKTITVEKQRNKKKYIQTQSVVS